MRKSTMFCLIAAAAMFLAQPALYADQGKGKGMHGGDKDCEQRCMKGHGGPGHIFGDPARMQKELGLTDAQATKIGDINKEYEKKMLDYREKLAPKEIQLRKLLLEDNVDMDKVKALIREISEIRGDLQVLRIQQRLEIEKVLTPEQKAKLKKHRMGKMDKMKKGKGPGPGPDHDM
jgi:Spy/CpxP family protein refolding chaperone